MIFKDRLHEEFYKTNVSKTNSGSDPYRKALFYTLGLTAETRDHIVALYDYKEKCIDFDGLCKGWQTGTSKKVTRLAFNLYNGCAYDSDEDFQNGKLSQYYVVDEIFCCGLAPYFYEAIKLRYPEYTHANNALLKEGCGVRQFGVKYPVTEEIIGAPDLFVDD